MESASGHGSSGTLSARVREFVATPLTRNASSLIGSTIATSLLGFIFWIVAARLYPTSTIGRDATAISTMVFLASLAQLNLHMALNRFVPTAGRRTGRLVVLAYCVAITLAALAAATFLLGIHLWSPRLSFLTATPTEAAWFVVATMIWAIFVLQDSVLAGLGEAHWVLIENVLYGVGKLAALVVAAHIFTHGVFLAWTVPLVLFVAAINLLLGKRLIPARKNDPVRATVALIEVGRYASIDFAASLLWTATTGLLPLIVLGAAGARASAYVYLSWTVAYTLYLVTLNVGMSMITEGSRSPDRLLEYARKGTRYSLVIVGVLSVLLVVSAPLALRLFGADYAAEATGVLQLFALSAIPYAFIALTFSILRVQRRMRTLFLLSASHATATLSLSYLGLRAFGVVGVGVGWFFAQSVVAIGVLAGELRTIWVPLVRVRTLPSRLTRIRNVGTRAAVADTEALMKHSRVFDEWERVESVEHHSNFLSFAVRSRANGARAVLKIATPTDVAARALQRGEAMITKLAAAGPAPIRAVVPHVLARGAEHGRPWVVETIPTGRPISRALGGTEPATDIMLDAVDVMTSLYRSSHTQALVDRYTLDLLVGEPLAAIGAISTSPLRRAADEAKLTRIGADLEDELAERSLSFATVHGNLWPGNVFSDNRHVTTIAGWEDTGLDVPIVDVMHFIWMTEALAANTDLGVILCNTLRGGRLNPYETRIAERVPWASELKPRTIALIVWLRHVSRNANQLRSRDDLWRIRNIHEVLEAA